MTSLLQSELFHRFWAVAGAASIRVKVLGILLAVVIIMGTFLTVQMRRVLTTVLTDHLELQGVAISQQIAVQLEHHLDESMIPSTELLDEFAEHYSNESHNTLVAYLLLVDNNGNILASSQPDLDPALLATWEPDRESIRHIEGPEETFIDVIAPLHNGTIAVQLGLSDANLRDAVATMTRQMFYALLLMIILGAAAAILLIWILTRPLLILVEATGAVARGDFSRRISRWANDEIGDLSEAFNQMTEALEKAEAERKERELLRESYIRKVITAQEEERKRVARELHDSTSQSLTSLLVGLRNLESLKDLENLKGRLESLREIVSGTLDEVHLMAWQLRPSVLDDLGLSAALKQYVNNFQRHFDLHVDFIMHGLTTGRLPAAVETTVYRIVQEGLTNVARHASAENASVLVERRAGGLRMIIEDDGSGFDPAAVKRESLGLQGIRERASLLDGSVTIESVPGSGTSLFIEIPVGEAKESA